MVFRGAVRPFRPWPYGFWVVLWCWLGLGCFGAAWGVPEGSAGGLAPRHSSGQARGRYEIASLDTARGRLQSTHG